MRVGEGLEEGWGPRIASVGSSLGMGGDKWFLQVEAHSVLGSIGPRQGPRCILLTKLENTSLSD